MSPVMFFHLSLFCLNEEAKSSLSLVPGGGSPSNVRRRTIPLAIHFSSASAGVGQHVHRLMWVIIGVYPRPALRHIGDLDDLLLDGVLHQLCLVVNVELAHQVELMGLDG
jgi:hypothetical protein